MICNAELGRVAKTALASATGTRLQRIAYLPYGKKNESISSGMVDVNHKFTGQEHDDSTDLYFYNARYYDPALGRFIQADTIVPNPANPQDLNRYSYVRNNPINMVDPSGHSAHWANTTTVGGSQGTAYIPPTTPSDCCRPTAGNLSPTGPSQPNGTFVGGGVTTYQTVTIGVVGGVSSTSTTVTESLMSGNTIFAAFVYPEYGFFSQQDIQDMTWQTNANWLIPYKNVFTLMLIATPPPPSASFNAGGLDPLFSGGCDTACRLAGMPGSFGGGVPDMSFASRVDFSGAAMPVLSTGGTGCIPTCGGISGRVGHATGGQGPILFLRTEGSEALDVTITPGSRPNGYCEGCSFNPDSTLSTITATIQPGSGETTIPTIGWSNGATNGYFRVQGVGGGGIAELAGFTSQPDPHTYPIFPMGQ